MNKRIGQFSGGGFFSADGQTMIIHMGPFGPFGSTFMVQKVPIIYGPIAYYPATTEQKKSVYWPLMSPVNIWNGGY